MSYGQQPYWDWSNHKVCGCGNWEGLTSALHVDDFQLLLSIQVLDEVEAGYRLEIPKVCRHVFEV